ncbi:MAG: hypothetical protein COT26_01295 [Candidatus Kerfeldbacteria bacterium CG08_land_8_20_14_0_20_43_14]|uniref:Uncharacterized protein n=1 Tax=Candidatus Kerfeldbacteria bacterium CG08_land_8_20_14_0_20_43_14 TaxID=2014246 RepID=A0A2H0YQQ6_9BACT|nr:MAG: hypothetical protein COT26_01295 [Candidatus Kerfeldbacteria bacterium CG08_land_8_20_14_0_20_43_14]
MKKTISTFPNGQISLVMLGQTMYYSKSSSSAGKRIAQQFFSFFKTAPKSHILKFSKYDKN